MKSYIKTLLFTIIAATAINAQAVIVTGTVIDENKEPVI